VGVHAALHVTWLHDVQEVEMGTLSVGLDAIGRRVGFLEGGTQVGQPQRA
jgi:hypothetical protein